MDGSLALLSGTCLSPLVLPLWRGAAVAFACTWRFARFERLLPHSLLPSLPPSLTQLPFGRVEKSTSKSEWVSKYAPDLTDGQVLFPSPLNPQSPQWTELHTHLAWDSFDW